MGNLLFQNQGTAQYLNAAIDLIRQFPATIWELAFQSYTKFETEIETNVFPI